MHLSEIRGCSHARLLELAESLGVSDLSLGKQKLIVAILKNIASTKKDIFGEGVLATCSDGFGFLRSAAANYLPGPDDIYVSPQYIQKYGLRNGDSVSGKLLSPQGQERFFSLESLETINGLSPSSYKHRVHFDHLTPVFPDRKISLEIETPTSKDLTTRMIDIITPIGFGQRALIVAPPRTGKTEMMQRMAQSIAKNHPDALLMVLLIDERPEEVTEMKRAVRGEVLSSTFDEPADRHIQVAEMAIERARRMVENGRDVIIFLDSITRLARAYNTVVPASGKILTGGVDANALQKPKRLFGAARNVEQSGSLTIIGTALVETGSRMDEVIFEEFKGTGNAEIVLDRRLSDKRVFPAIDISKSGTRKENLLMPKPLLSRVWILRRIMTPMGVAESTEFLIDKMKRTKNNADFFDSMNGQP